MQSGSTKRSEVLFSCLTPPVAVCQSASDAMVDAIGVHLLASVRSSKLIIRCLVVDLDGWKDFEERNGKMRS